MIDQHIAIVILHYNSEKDLQICAEQISRQKNVHLSIILVDNASQPESLNALKRWLADWRSDAVSGTADIVYEWVQQHPEETRKQNRV